MEYSNIHDVLTHVRGQKVDIKEGFILLNDILKKYEINVRAHMANGEINKVIITSGRHKCDYSSFLVTQCNGIIVNPVGWKILVMPPQGFNPNYVKKDFSRAFYKNSPSYTVYKANDGTVVSLYYFDNKWCISSTKGPYMNDTIWMGNKSYEQILSELFAKENYSTSSLDKSRCYTIGFKHPNMHPFAGESHIWYIQSVLLDTMVVDVENPTPFSEQETINILSKEAIYILMDECESALWSYIKSKKILHGYILRSNDFEKTGEYSNILIESTLMKKIRQFVYQSLPKDISTIEVNNENRMHYITLRSFLDYVNNDKFISLFPQYKSTFTTYSSKFNKLVDVIITSMCASKSSGNNDIDTLIEFIKSQKIDPKRINPKNMMTHQLISDAIKHIRFTGIIYKIFNTM